MQLIKDLFFVFLPIGMYAAVLWLRYKFLDKTRFLDKLQKFPKETTLLLTAAVCFGVEIACMARGVFFVVPVLWQVPYLMFGALEDKRRLAAKKSALIADGVGIAAGLLLLGMFCTRHRLSFYFYAEKAGVNLLQYSFLMLLSWVLCYFIIDLWLVIRGMKKKKNRPDRQGRWPLLIGMLAAMAVMVVFGMIIERMGLQSGASIWSVFYRYFTEPVHILNLYLALLFCFCFYYLFGKGIGILIDGLLTLILFIAELIKLKFHGTFFSWMDLQQIKEMFLISKDFLTVRTIMLILIGLALLVAAIVKWRRQIGRFLKPRFRVIPAAAAACLLAMLIWMVYGETFKEDGVYYRALANEQVNVENNGLLVGLLYNLNNMSGASAIEVENYSEETAKEIEEAFDRIGSFSTDHVKPDVLLVLSESLFDLDGVPGITLSQDIDSTMDKYADTRLISSRFGGYTAAVEFEALTGLTLAFMPDGVIPYVSYFDGTSGMFPSVVQEFKDNGYVTTGMHPNLPDFYNRAAAFRQFGFDSYQSITSFDLNEQNTTKNGWMLDSAFGDRVIQQMESTDKPQFLFAITVEGHYFNVDKYDDPLVKAVSEQLSPEQINEVEQQATAYYEADQLIAKLIQYIDSRERPTLLYVFGDHLPPMSALGTLGYTQDLYNQYTTSFLMYSNYKKLSAGVKYITPNQIAAQMMEDSGIAHSSYYDYIYSLRETYPILHKEFVNVEDNPDLAEYYFLQQDILFGNHYLYQKNKNNDNNGK